MDIDIVIYAVVALVILARLWTVFGRRSEGDHERPNPFAARMPPAADPQRLPGNAETPALMPKPLALAPASLAGGIEAVHTLDPSFDKRNFSKARVRRLR